MHFVAFRTGGKTGLAASRDGKAYHGLLDGDPRYPGTLDDLIRQTQAALETSAEALLSGQPVDVGNVELLQPLRSPGKVICVGLNYRDHASEAGHKPPEYPTLFARFGSSLIGPNDPIVRPIDSIQLDYEGELVAVIGKLGRRISKANALDHVAGYSIFNDGSVRDFQLRSAQWTLGKNFDGTGAFGPVFVTADALPPGARGLKIETRLNGQIMQSASTDDLIFDVATLVADISAGITLEPGDLIVTGTPSGVGAARKPPVFMKSGDVCEVEIEKIGTLRNRVVDEAADARPLQRAAAKL
jgi:2-keto-4-pentenoate hydratase/2-oxohepta-3-ene-1,7-dioic acid hydratase in catechol pathway